MGIEFSSLSDSFLNNMVEAIESIQAKVKDGGTSIGAQQQEKHGFVSTKEYDTFFPPYSKQLQVDGDLTLGCGTVGDLQQKVKSLLGNATPVTYDIDSVPPYPSLKILATFAKAAYNGNEEDMNIPEGWVLLTTASNTNLEYCYSGAVFLHPKNKHVVIAHKGTNVKDIGAIWTDINIYFNGIPKQIESACTFAEIIRKVLGANFEYFFTGHSLGGWLAQVTTFSAKYLVKEGTLFQRAHELSKGYHAHAIVFESPGCEPMLHQMKKEFDLRHEGEIIHLQDLDITTYLSAPNRINTCNPHLGTVIRVFTDVSDKKFWQLHDIVSHTMPKMLRAIHEPQREMVTVLDWPIWTIMSPAEWNKFFQFANETNNYNPDILKTIAIGERTKIRYQTKRYVESRINLNVFTKFEQDFLRGYKWLHGFSESFNGDQLFALLGDHREKVQGNLEGYEIKKGHIKCKGLERFIPYVKQLLHFHCDLHHALKRHVSAFGISKQLYRKECSDFCKKIERKFPFALKSAILNAKASVCLVTVECGDHNIDKMMITAAKTIQALKNVNCTILELQQLLSINRLVAMKDFASSPELGQHLFVIVCKPNHHSFQEAQQLFQGISGILIKNPKIRLVLITKKDDDITVFFQEECKGVFGTSYIAEEDNGIVWSDLTTESQKFLLDTPRVNFNGGKVLLSLNNLIENAMNEAALLMSPQILNQIIVHKEMVIGREAQHLGVLPSAFMDVYEDISESCLKIALLGQQKEHDECFYMIRSSVVGSLDELLRLLQIKAVDETKIDFKGVQDNDARSFQELCNKNASQKVYWIQHTHQHTRCLRIYNPNFYQKRKFTFVNLDNVLKLKESGHRFIITGATEGMKTDNNSNVFIYKEADAEAGSKYQELCETESSVHWLKCYKKQLIWFRSHGIDDLKRDVRNRKYTTGIEEQNLLNFIDKVLVICGEPGMGKSTTLISLSECIKTEWVIRKNLADCTLAIEDLNIKEVTLQNAIDFISLDGSTKFANELLKLALQGKTKQKFYLLLDGYDEISTEERKSLMKLIMFLRIETKCNIWVTARKHSMKELEDGLKIFAIVFAEIQNKEQKNFLKRFWKTRFDLTLAEQNFEDKLSQYTEAVLKCTSKILGKDSSKNVGKNASMNVGKDSSKSPGKNSPNFMGIPLQLRMLAEAFPPKPSYLTLPTNLSQLEINLENQTNLYHRFMQKKYDIFFVEKRGYPTHYTSETRNCCTQALVKKHRNLAFQLLFPNESDFLRRNSREDKHPDLADLKQVGLIELMNVDDSVSFIHRSIAEYFAADLLAYWLNKPEGRHPSNPSVEVFFLNTIMLQSEHKVIRLFLNAMLNLQEPCESYTRQTENLWHDKESNFKIGTNGPTPLHVAAEEGLENIVDFLARRLKASDENLEQLLLAHNGQGKSALYIAEKKRYEGVVDKLLDSLKHCSAEGQQKLLLEVCLRTHERNEDSILEKSQKKPHLQAVSSGVRNVWDSVTLLFRAAHDGESDEIQKVLNQVGDIDTGKIYREKLRESTNKYKDTALVMAARQGHLAVVNVLIEEGANVNTAYNSTPLAEAANKGLSSVVAKLLENGANPNLVGKKSGTPLQKAVKSGCLEIVNMLLDHNATPCIQDKTNPYCCYKEHFERNTKLLDNSLRYPLIFRDKLEPDVPYENQLLCYAPIVEKAIKLFGLNHINTLATIASYSNKLYKSKKYQEALQYYQMVFQIIPHVGLHQSDSILTLTKCSIANIFSMLDQYQHALSHYEEVLTDRENSLGPNHQKTLIIRHYIAMIKSYQGEFDEAVLLYQDLLDKIKDLNISGAVDAIQHNMAQIKAHKGDFEGSMQLFRANYEIYHERNGENHRHSLFTKLNIGQVLANKGNYTEALSYYDQFLKPNEKSKNFTTCIEQVKLQMKQLQSETGENSHIHN